MIKVWKTGGKIICTSKTGTKKFAWKINLKLIKKDEFFNFRGNHYGIEVYYDEFDNDTYL